MKAMKSSPHRLNSRPQQGYVLLILVLCMAMVAIAAAIIAPTLATQIRRDKEEELIHRATQYRRAVRRFTKQTGRFPMKLEDLENTNGVRYLRKRYKDPMTGKDFRVLRMGEIPAAIGTSASLGSLLPATNTNQDGSANDQDSSDAPAVAAGQAQTQASTSSIQANSGFSTSLNANAQPGSLSPPSQGNQQFGGGVIIGVVSTSPKKTIREFNRKKRYNEWFFFYDPTFDRGFEIQGPTPLIRPPADLQGPPNSAAQQTQPSAPQPLPAANPSQ